MKVRFDLSMVILGCLFLGLVSCSEEKDAEIVTPTFVEITDIKADFVRKEGMIRFNAVAHFNNPNDQTLLITDHDMSFFVDGVRLGGLDQIEQRLPVGEDAKVAFSAYVTVEGVMMAIDAPIDGSMADMQGGVSIRGPITFARDSLKFPVEITYDQSVKLPSIN